MAISFNFESTETIINSNFYSTEFIIKNLNLNFSEQNEKNINKFIKSYFE